MIATLDDLIIKLESGSRPKGGVRNGSLGIPSLGAEHLNNIGGFKFEKIKYIPEDFFKNQKKGLIGKEDILIVKDGATTGKVSFIDNNFPYEKASINEHLFKIALNINLVIPRYVFWYLFSNRGLKQILQDFRGATVGGISRNFTKNIKFLLPSIENQKRVVKILDQAASLRQKRIEAIGLLEDYLKSVFLEMFGDPMKNPKGWMLKKFATLGTLDRGMSKHRPRNAPELLGGDHPLIQTGDVAKSNIYIKAYKSTYSDIGLKQSKKWPKGTLCITIAANIAKTGILTFDACFPDSVVGFVADNRLTNNEYILFWISFLQEMLEINAPESAQKNINLKILRELDVMLPPLELQNRFSEIVYKTESLRQKMLFQSRELDNQFQAFMQKSFTHAN